jgi:hypothetical protein
VIAPHRAARSGWREAFAAAGSADDGLLLTQVPANLFDSEEWSW